MFKVNNTSIDAYITAKGHTVEPGTLKLVGFRGGMPRDEQNGDISLDDNAENFFNDAVGYFGSEFALYPATVDPGDAEAQNPGGNAHLCSLTDDGGAPWTFKHWMHHGVYPCLIQDGPVTVLRDDGQPHSGSFDIEIHHAGVNSQTVNNWSLGCQVLSKIEDWGDFWTAIQQSGQSSFVYYLIDAADYCKWAGLI